MLRFASTITLVTLLSPTSPGIALPGLPRAGIDIHERQAGLVVVDWRRHGARRHPRYGGTVGPNGGYRVNRYGYGNYVAGPNGGFAGYPAGSAGARIYRQKQEWKCEAVPEMC